MKKHRTPSPENFDLSAAIQRHRPGGWTIARMESFLAALVETGNVQQACEVVALSRQSAYLLRERNAAFDKAWKCALDRHTENYERMLRQILDDLESEWDESEVPGLASLSDHELQKRLAKADRMVS